MADGDRITLCEVYLQIIGGNEKLPLPTLFRNLPILLKVMATASSRIRSLTTLVLENPQHDRSGYHMGHLQMILGLLYKIKKKRALALEHLTEAKEYSPKSDKPLQSRGSMRLSRNWDNSVTGDNYPQRRVRACKIFILLFVTPLTVRAERNDRLKL